MRSMRWFVAGTDTGVGKTEAACALLSLLADEGLRPAPFKPYESGCRNLSAPADARALRAAARCDDDLSLICPHRFRAPVAPGVAAMRAGVTASIHKTLRAFRSFDGRPVIAEGAGGLFVPVDAHRDVIDLIALLRMPVLLVARAGLGTLNHIALSIEALASRDIPLAAVLLARSSPQSDSSQLDNPELIRERHGVTVLGPVPFRFDRARRRTAFRRALKPLLQR